MQGGKRYAFPLEMLVLILSVHSIIHLFIYFPTVFVLFSFYYCSHCEKRLAETYLFHYLFMFSMYLFSNCTFNLAFITV